MKQASRDIGPYAVTGFFLAVVAAVLLIASCVGCERVEPTAKVPETKAEATARYVKARAAVIAKARKCPCGLEACGDAREAAFLAAEAKQRAQVKADKLAYEKTVMEFRWNHPRAFWWLTWKGLDGRQAGIATAILLTGLVGFLVVCKRSDKRRANRAINRARHSLWFNRPPTSSEWNQ